MTSDFDGGTHREVPVDHQAEGMLEKLEDSPGLQKSHQESGSSRRKRAKEQSPARPKNNNWMNIPTGFRLSE